MLGMSETSISRTAVQQRSWCWGILKRREHKCDLYADVHDVQVHAFIYHLSLLSSSEFLCALTQGATSKVILLLPAVLPYASLVSQSDSAPSCTHQAALMHSDTSSGHTQMPLASGTISLSVRGQGPTQSEKNGTRLLTLWAHWWLPG